MNKKTIFHRFPPISSQNKPVKNIIQNISSIVHHYNLDNISRTKAYQTFYLKHPEIKWAFLASMVSRNAGWNMCDLKGNLLPHVLKEEMIHTLFLTYERANWMIFQDAFTQLLVYHYSTKENANMFHLLEEFPISKFMKKEWAYFWKHRDEQRLMQSLIINEQNLIQKPVMEHPVYKKKVFQSKVFLFEDFFHFSSVLFPTRTGHLYGASVHQFRNLDERIKLGNQLSQILFNDTLYTKFLDFAIQTEPTGSRREYEQYSLAFPHSKRTFLRSSFPIIEHHIHEYQDWSMNQPIKKKWYEKRKLPKEIHLTKWFTNKQKQLDKLVKLEEIFRR